MVSDLSIIKLSKENENEISGIYDDSNVSEKIPIKYCSRIDDRRYNEYVIYDGYKPNNLRTMINYMDFCLTFRKTLPDKVCSYGYISDIDDTNKNAIDSSEYEDSPRSSKISQELKLYYNTELKTSLPAQLDQEQILAFDSNFGSGNLDRVNISSLTEYNLFLKPDTNTRGHSQWFYYSVTNTHKNTKITFNILNCTKPIELFRVGMRPIVFSEHSFKFNKTQWSPDTFNVSYSRNNILKNPNQILLNEAQCYYTLSFSYIFKYSGDKVYFSYSHPYTLNMYFSLLNKIQEKFFKNPKEVKLLKTDNLQMEIKRFIESPMFKTLENERNSRTKKSVSKKLTINDIRIHPYISPSVLKEYKNANHSFEWMKNQEFIAETQEIIYKQEVLCRTFSGIPIILLTITNPRYIFYNSKKNKIVLGNFP